MRVVRWLVAVLVGALLVGFVVSLVRPHRSELPRPVTS
jgi:hypothetical protein